MWLKFERVGSIILQRHFENAAFHTIISLSASEQQLCRYTLATEILFFLVMVVLHTRDIHSLDQVQRAIDRILRCHCCEC